MAARARNPLQVLREAREIARGANLRIAECKNGKGNTEYVVYRLLPHQGDIRIGKRSSITGLRTYVADLAKFH